VTGKDDGQFDCALVTFSVANARAISGKFLFALVDVEMHIAGVSFAILGIQARNAPNGCTSVHLPTYRDTMANGGRRSDCPRNCTNRLPMRCWHSWWMKDSRVGSMMPPLLEGRALVVSRC
jgi:hypothetical protein